MDLNCLLILSNNLIYYVKIRIGVNPCEELRPLKVKYQISVLVKLTIDAI